MSNLLTLNTDLEQHYLQHEFANKAILIEEPFGWKTSNKKLKRNSETNEMIEKNAKNIAFIGKGREYLKNTDAIYGSNCRVRYTVVKENPRDSTDFYKDIYFVNLETHIDKNGEFAVQIDEGGLAQIIKAKQNEKFEIDRETTLNGNNIGTFKSETLTIEGRKIFLKTFFEKEQEEWLYLTSRASSFNSSRGYISIPLEIAKQNSHLDYAFSVAGYSHNSGDKEQLTPKKSDAFLNCENLPKNKKLKLKLLLKSTLKYAVNTLNGKGHHILGVNITIFNDKKAKKMFFQKNT